MPVPSLSSSSAAIEQLLGNSAQIWRGHAVARSKARSTGYAALDALLPGGGWPIGALTELIPLAQGIGEVALLWHALKELCVEKRRIVFVKPPYIPYAPALQHAGLPLSLILWIDTAQDEEAHWAAEQTLREGAAGAVLLWSAASADRPLRRLQLAAEDAESLAFVYRPAAMLRNPSPAALRILLRPSPSKLGVEIIKARGGRSGTVLLPIAAAL